VPGDAEAAGAGKVDESQAERVEARVAELVAAGGDEKMVRSLVREAVRLGRGTGGRPSTIDRN